MLDFIDLKSQQARIRERVDAALKRVLDHGNYIMGPEVYELERQLAEFCGAEHTISCANGTDAIGMVLMALDIGPGDAVFVPAFTFAATAEVVAWVGAKAVFVDCLPETFNMDPKSLEEGIRTAQKLGLVPKIVIPVDLFGQPADYEAIEPIAQQYNLTLISDAAQSFGATYRGRSVGTIGKATTTSFFPAKPLGCYGDGGAIFTNDPELTEKLKSIRVHGQGVDKYQNIRIGINGRLDTFQAAVLLEKLAIFPDEIKSRQAAADFYSQNLSSNFFTPTVLEGCTSVWAQYTIVTHGANVREMIQKRCFEKGIPTAIYYPIPLHKQLAYRSYPTAGEGPLSVCEDLAQKVLSLPMHPYLTQEIQETIVDCVNGSV